MSALHNPRPQGLPHQRVGWKAEEFFSDPGVIALCKAIEAKNLKEIGRLIKSGTDVNTTGRGNMTPLLWAFPMGEEVFRRVLEHGADPNIQLTEEMLPGLKPGDSVTSAAAYAGGALTGFFYDISMDNYLKLVLKHGGNPHLENALGETPLFKAVHGVGNSSERIRLLLDAGADINHRDTGGCTAAMNAEGRLRYDSLLILLKAGADCEIISNIGKDLVYQVARRDVIPGGYQVKEQTAVRDFLKKKGYDLAAARRAYEKRHIVSSLNLPADQRPWLNSKADDKEADGEN
jgi:hypothetical protein